MTTSPQKIIFGNQTTQMLNLLHYDGCQKKNFFDMLFLSQSCSSRFYKKNSGPLGKKKTKVVFMDPVFFLPVFVNCKQNWDDRDEREGKDFAKRIRTKAIFLQDKINFSKN